MNGRKAREKHRMHRAHIESLARYWHEIDPASSVESGIAHLSTLTKPQLRRFHTATMGVIARQMQPDRKALP